MSGSNWYVFVNDTGARTQVINADEVNADLDWAEGHIVPHNAGVLTGDTYDLGTTSAYWRRGYIRELRMPDNTTTALDINEAGNSYLSFVTTNAGEKILASQDLDVGIADYDKLTISDNGTSKGVISKFGNDSFMHYGFNAYYTGTAWASWDATRHSGMLAIRGNTAGIYFYFYGADPSSAPSIETEFLLWRSGTTGAKNLIIDNCDNFVIHNSGTGMDFASSSRWIQFEHTKTTKENTIVDMFSVTLPANHKSCFEILAQMHDPHTTGGAINNCAKWIMIATRNAANDVTCAVSEIWDVRANVSVASSDIIGTCTAGAATGTVIFMIHNDNSHGWTTTTHLVVKSIDGEGSGNYSDLSRITKL